MKHFSFLNIKKKLLNYNSKISSNWKHIIKFILISFKKYIIKERNKKKITIYK